MPELPEVEIVRRGMEPALKGKQIERLIYKRADLRFALPPALPGLIKGQRIERLIRRGKYILGFAGNGHGFILHLGMSGVIKVVAPEAVYAPQKHDHVIFELSGGERVVFNDARRFGFLIAAEESAWAGLPPFNRMGPEPLEDLFDADYLYKALQPRKGPIKNALLDQALVAGIGNIYACEALFRSAIAPARKGQDVSKLECGRLVASIQAVLREALESGGSSLRDYRNTKGKMGYFQHSFSVYDRACKPCPDCLCTGDEGGGVKRIMQSGRSTFFCERKQK